MPITISALHETADAEARVALTPDATKKLVAQGHRVLIETGAGLGAFYNDQAYRDAGAEIATDSAQAVAVADVVVGVQMPAPHIIRQMKAGAVLAGLSPVGVPNDAVQIAADSHVTLMAMERVPRISRAQAMDVLSSQSNLAGYRAVIEAAAFYGRAFPMMMTAAGTVAAAKVMVMGAGVAGLQAIATARRLGAVVSATDVRLAAKEQVESLGAKFVMVEDDETKAAETSGGYARDMSDAYKAKQAALIAETIKKQDIVITTALIPGRAAPRLVTDAMVKTMKPGSVIVDLAVEAGGNVEGVQAGQTVMRDGVMIVGYKNLAARVAHDASALYARNMLSLLQLVIDRESGAIQLNFDDEIIKTMILAHGGQVLVKG